MDSMKSWGKEGRKECLLCVRVLVTCCGIVLHIRSAFMLELRRELEIGLSAFRVLIVLRSHLMS